MPKVFLIAGVLASALACGGGSAGPDAANRAAPAAAAVPKPTPEAPAPDAPAEEPPAVVSPEAEAVLRAMSDKLAGASRISFKVRQEARAAADDPAPEKSEREVLMERPNRMRIRYLGEDKQRQTFYDGETVVVELTHKKVYMREPAGVSLDELLEKGGDLGLDTAFADVMYASPYDSFVGPGGKVKHAGSEDVAGKKCHRLDYEYPAVSGSLWVAEGDTPLPRKLVLNYSEPAGAVTVIEWLDWDLAAKVAEDSFRYTAPAGFNQIPLAKAPRKAGGSAVAATAAADASTTGAASGRK